MNIGYAFHYDNYYTNDTYKIDIFNISPLLEGNNTLSWESQASA